MVPSFGGEGRLTFAECLDSVLPGFLCVISVDPHKNPVSWRRKLGSREVKKFPKVTQLASGTMKT